MVTFTRAATSELRSRLRQRLVDVGAAMANEPTADPLAEHLVASDRERRLARIRRAISEFDTATITTIHGFATQVLGTLGATSGTDPDARLVDNSAELLDDVCEDVLASAAADGVAADELPTFAELRHATYVAMSAPDTTLIPDALHRDIPAAYTTFTRLVEEVTRVIARRRQRSGTMSFDDLLTHLRDALRGQNGPAATSSIRERFTVALIDEFQDTDPVQWEIFRILFGDSAASTSLRLVGDPKQAIFSFRGANVHTFLDAVASPGTVRRALRTNWRSDGAALEALEVLLGGTTLGDDAITFDSVQPAPANAAKRLTSIDGLELPALSIRLALDASIKRNEDRRPYAIKAEEGRRAIYLDLVAQVRDLLERGVLPKSEPEATGRPVKPSDIAVLVRTGREAEAVQRALSAQGVPAGIGVGTSVLESPAARQWRILLYALLRPSDPGRARGVALSWFVGWEPERLDRLGEEDLSGLQMRLGEWAESLERHGVARFVQQVLAESEVVARLLRRPDGDRHVTDLQHIGELFATATPRQAANATGLLSTLESEPTVDVDTDIDADLTARRTESEAEAVQVMTVWVAKGLEFPIVCVPTMCSIGKNDVVFQDHASKRRTFDVTKGQPWPDAESANDRKDRAAKEALGENFRLLYVALTRAQHQTILWWTRILDADRSALARVLFARVNGVIDPDHFASVGRLPLPDDADAAAFLQPLVDASAGSLAVETHGMRPARPDRWTQKDADRQRPALEVARLERLPDRAGHRWSFTSITRFAEVADFDPFDTSLVDRGAADETNLVESVLDARRSDKDEGSVAPTPAFALLPAGAAFGTLVHAVLEEVDFSGEQLGSDLERVVRRQLERAPLDLDGASSPEDLAVAGRERLVEGLVAVIATPLGESLGGITLRDLAPGDRLNELSFELHLGSGGHRPSVRDIGGLVVSHLGANDPFVPWASGLAGGAFDVALVGHLTGSIDMVMALGGGDRRYVVVDYKTNRLGDDGQHGRLGDYAQASMHKAMGQHHYPLQALLYSVALHRYLRGRLVGYDPARHLGGAAYLFVRGMTGTEVAFEGAQPNGVVHWQIPPALVEALSDLLHGSMRTREGQ